MNKRLVHLAAIILSALLLVLGNKIAVTNMPVFEHIYQDSCEKAVVTGILSRTSAAQIIEGVSYGSGTNITFAATLLTGENKGEMITALQNSDPYSPYQMRDVTAGDKILVTRNTAPESEIEWLMGEYVRSDMLILLGVVFCFLVILLGRMQGVNTILSLAFACLAVFVVFIPAVLSGKNIYFWSIATCTFIIVMTLVIVNGINKKSLCSGIGCFSGVIASGALTLLSNHFLQLTGMVDEESLYLKFLFEDRVIDLNAIIFAAIILGAVGAIMDVAMSLSSALSEIQTTNPELTSHELCKSGFNIGRDIMGTMANTLVLAYIGGSLSITLLLIAYSNSVLALVNREMIVVEILQALVGSFGILLTIPLTSLVCSIVYTHKKKPKNLTNSPETKPES